jgi:hypothetical protein
VDIIRLIKKVKGPADLDRAHPDGLFAACSALYALFSRKPPFTADQLEALSAATTSRAWTPRPFGFRQTPFEDAVRESYCDPALQPRAGGR